MSEDKDTRFDSAFRLSISRAGDSLSLLVTDICMFAGLKLLGGLNHAAGYPSAGVSVEFRCSVVTSAKIVGLGVDHDGSAQDALRS